MESKVLELEVVLEAGHLLLLELVDVPPKGLLQLEAYSGISFEILRDYQKEFYARKSKSSIGTLCLC